MDNNPQAVVAIKEENIIIDGIRLKKTTEVVATGQGILAREVIEANEINLPRSAPPIAQTRTSPALPPPRVVVINSPPPPSNETCVDFCFKCERGNKWYDFEGKGACVVFLLLLGYLIASAFLFIIFLLAYVCGCLDPCDGEMEREINIGQSTE